jgi:hypothetical protein
MDHSNKDIGKTIPMKGIKWVHLYIYLY